MDLRDAIIVVLENGGLVDVAADLACFKYGNQYCVEYWYDERTVDLLEVTDSQRKEIRNDEELLEFFETPEEAADFCLKIGHNLPKDEALMEEPVGKRTLQQKLASVKKDEYF